MKNKAMETRIGEEVMDFIASRKSLQLSSITPEGMPYASYAPFAIGQECLYVLLSDIAVHAANLRCNARASVLVIEDEDTAQELFARVRVNYAMRADLLEYGSDDFRLGLEQLVKRHGERPRKLSELSDFSMFRLVPEGGRYVKGFGKAFTLEGGSLAGESLSHMRDGHRPRPAA